MNDEDAIAIRWFNWTRHLYHLGILALLTGVAVMVLPPPNDADAWRWGVSAVAVVGALAELAWIVSSYWPAGRREGEVAALQAERDELRGEVARLEWQHELVEAAVRRGFREPSDAVTLLRFAPDGAGLSVDEAVDKLATQKPYLLADGPRGSRSA